MVMMLQSTKPSGWDGTTFADQGKVSFACEFGDGTRVSYSLGQSLYCTANNLVVHHGWKSSTSSDDENETQTKVLDGVWIQQFDGPTSSKDSVTASHVTPQGNVVQWIANGNI